MSLRNFFYIALLLLAPFSVSAHGFGARIDLPVPLHLYAIGAGAVVALSFVIMGVFIRRGEHNHLLYSAYNLCRLRVVRAIFESTVLRRIIQASGVIFLFLIIVGGLFGVQQVAFNIAPTSVWILFSVGLIYFVALIGNIWNILNPFKTVFEIGEKMFGTSFSARRWPATLGVWPAFLGLFLFRWVENVFPLGANPQTLASFVIVYALITFAGMLYFGKDTWLNKGDPFGVLFRFLSYFSITEVREQSGTKALYVRPPVVGILSAEKMDVSKVFFVLLLLATVSFDGLSATPAWQTFQLAFLEIGIVSIYAKTLGFILLIFAFASVFYFFSYLTSAITRAGKDVFGTAQDFILSLLPIAVAYEIAHFASLILIEGQRIIYLISDPFGFGWNIFGTAGYEVNIQIVSIKALWNFQIALIVLGHIAAVYVAHVLALKWFKDRKVAMRSQYPIMLLMVGYTMLGLWILAQPIVVVAS